MSYGPRYRPLVVKSPHAGGIAFHNDAGKAVWRCAWCGFLGLWADGWGRYGSLLDDDHGHFPGVTCSPACARALAEANGWPAEGLAEQGL